MIVNLKFLKKKLPLVSILLIISWLFLPIISIFFVQDDFFLLRISRANSVQDVFYFFVPRVDAVWYRPLSSQIFFFLNQLFFGLNPLPYHLFVLTIHLLTVWMVYRLALALKFTQTEAIIAGFFYGAHQIHIISLSWLACFSFILGPFFLVCTLERYFLGRKKTALFFYFLSVLTTELLLLIPLLFVLAKLLVKIQIKRWEAFWFGLLSVGIFILRFIIYPSKLHAEQYTLSVVQFIRLSKFYLLRIFGIPLLFEPLSLLNKIVSILFALFFVTVLTLGLINIRRRKKNINLLILLSSMSFILLLPFLLLPFHIASYYAAFSITCSSLLFAHLINQGITTIPLIHKKISLGIILFYFLIAQIIGINWTYKTHWIFRRAAIAKELVKNKKFQHPINTEEFFALGAGEAEHVY